MKVRTKAVKVKSADTQEVSALFNQMIGVGNMEITYPKYITLRNICSSMVKVFTMLAESPFFKLNTNFSKQREEILQFCSVSCTQIQETFSIEYTGDISLLSEEEQKKFDNHFMKMRKSPIIKSMTTIYNKLTLYKKHYSALDALSYKFIIQMAGVEWKPFPFTTLDLKYLFTLPNINDNTIYFFMTVLYKCHSIGQQLFQLLSSPDIDINKFVDVIMSNIEEIQKRPELHRCNKAFKKIKDSVQLLKDRFGNYYKDFLDTENQNIMMEHFILDVSKEANGDPQLIMQFRTIINYYRKQVQSTNMNPNIKAMVDKFAEQFGASTGEQSEVKIKETLSDTDSGEDDTEKPTVCPMAVSTTRDATP
jgi:hypothetical protein